MSDAAKAHTLDVRVYYEDTDTAGVVYYANYLKFAERARTEFLREAGFEQSDLLEQEKIGFVVRRCIVDYLKPAKLDDHLTIHTRIHDINNVSVAMHQVVKRDDDILVTLDVKLAVVGENMQLARLPDAIRTAMFSACK